MVKQTSIEAFIEILPRIGDRQDQILEHLGWVGMATDRMIAASLKLPINCITGRRNELVKSGLLRKVKTDWCEATRMIEGKRRRAIYWCTTDLGHKVITFKKRQGEVK
ncbi:hypothetical protein LCGC14_2020160 [marine sediment metagenome]|uniref:Uncharacterized protein n=1 Tax=marine sediment metagenome TaxID=412755 RepID=A0A0F9EY11_9ZZZZ